MDKKPEDKSISEKLMDILKILYRLGLGDGVDNPEMIENINSITQTHDQIMGLFSPPKVENNSYPCSNCNTGWGGASSNGIETCHNTCERFQIWLKSQKNMENL